MQSSPSPVSTIFICPPQYQSKNSAYSRSLFFTVFQQTDLLLRIPSSSVVRMPPKKIPVSPGHGHIDNITKEEVAKLESDGKQQNQLPRRLDWEGTLRNMQSSPADVLKQFFSDIETELQKNMPTGVGIAEHTLAEYFVSLASESLSQEDLKKGAGNRFKLRLRRVRPYLEEIKKSQEVLYTMIQEVNKDEKMTKYDCQIEVSRQGTKKTSSENEEDRYFLTTSMRGYRNGESGNFVIWQWNAFLKINYNGKSYPTTVLSAVKLTNGAETRGANSSHSLSAYEEGDSTQDTELARTTTTEGGNSVRRTSMQSATSLMEKIGFGAGSTRRLSTASSKETDRSVPQGSRGDPSPKKRKSAQEPSPQSPEGSKRRVSRPKRRASTNVDVSDQALSAGNVRPGNSVHEEAGVSHFPKQPTLGFVSQTEQWPFANADVSKNVPFDRMYFADNSVQTEIIPFPSAYSMIPPSTTRATRDGSTSTAPPPTTLPPFE